ARVVGDQDHPALLDRRRDLLRDRLHDLPPKPRVKVGGRPQIPQGPYLVIGLARSGVAAALALAARGEQVIGIDSGEGEGTSALREEAIELHLGGSAPATLL